MLGKWGLTRQNRTLTFIVMNIFEPMSIITGTVTLVYFAFMFNAINVLYVIMYAEL